VFVRFKESRVPDSKPIYREHAPSAVLAPWVACYWTVQGGVAAGEERTHRVLPDGCLDVLFNLADGLPGAVFEPRPPSYVVGTMTRPIGVRRAGTMDLLGVRFRPGRVTPFVPFPASELTDDIVALEDVWGPAARSLRDRLRELGNPAGRMALMNQVLEERLGASGLGDGAVQAAALLAERHGGQITVERLADATGLGRRQLERRFLAVVGVPPKTACRVLRFQGALARLTGSPHTPLSRVALEAGYHDQAHFTREFRALAGVSPGSYRRGLAADATP
jgi:AraC-like DNA-binding protein